MTITFSQDMEETPHHASMPKFCKQSGCPTSDPKFEDDDFRMYFFKVVPCDKRYCHDWTTCPWAHPGEKARRRSPLLFNYQPVACPDMKQNGHCGRGENCEYAHNVFEYWLHPSRYRTQLCNDFPRCRRSVCFFAHQQQQLRRASTPHPPIEAAKRLGIPLESPWCGLTKSTQPDVLPALQGMPAVTLNHLNRVQQLPEPESTILPVVNDARLKNGSSQIPPHGMMQQHARGSATQALMEDVVTKYMQSQHEHEVLKRQLNVALMLLAARGDSMPNSAASLLSPQSSGSLGAHSGTFPAVGLMGQESMDSIAPPPVSLPALQAWPSAPAQAHSTSPLLSPTSISTNSTRDGSPLMSQFCGPFGLPLKTLEADVTHQCEQIPAAKLEDDDDDWRVLNTAIALEADCNIAG